MFKRILHPTDFSEVAHHAFEHALCLARRLGAELFVIHAVSQPSYDPDLVEEATPKLDEAWEAVRAELEKRMAALVEATGSDVTVTPLIRRGVRASDVILRAAFDLRAELTVMGTHGRSPMRHLLLGSVAEKVVRNATGPVLVVGHRCPPLECFRRIALPIDFSPASQQAGEIAAELARRDRAELHLVHVLAGDAQPAFSVNGVTSKVEIEERGRQALESFLPAAVTEGVTLAPIILRGRPSRQIVQWASREEIDVVVIGTHGRSGLPHFVLGSVTEKVLRNASQPVMAVPARTARRMDFIWMVREIRNRWGDVPESDRYYPQDYPRDFEKRFFAKDGSAWRMRPIRPEDGPLLRKSFARLSPQSIYLRFHCHMSKLTKEMSRYLTRVDYRRHLALVALEEAGGAGIGVARYFRREGSDLAEGAIVVVDEWHGRGIGRVLMEELCAAAKRNGIAGLEAYVLTENDGMLAILNKLGYRLHQDEKDGVIQLWFRFDERDLRGPTLNSLIGEGL
ncbi:GNAT family N-acetyltransferase [Planctomycetota bacterium]